MNQTTFWIYLNNYSNIICGIFNILNILWMLEMCINGYIQRKDINFGMDEVNWTIDLKICTLLSLMGMCALYLPAVSSGFGFEVYVIAVYIVVIQALMMKSYRKKLMKKISEAWFLTSTKVSMLISILTAISILAYAISSIVVFDY
ncbi:hypothetical protein [Lactobacillus iners]|jgi:hypothetical protein|uniref:Uncharacterized protein n=1 Tax=Lactobacillus iners TaxID=147802 RepID=A0A6G7BAN9_9LACO|nr:hypothetical protein [Lactobacillus iners]QIH24517.1 hypothetical protein G6Z83_07295 [Lactobacillus iners]